jgi:hypothetical protein
MKRPGTVCCSDNLTGSTDDQHAADLTELLRDS